MQLRLISLLDYTTTKNIHLHTYTCMYEEEVVFAWQWEGIMTCAAFYSTFIRSY